MCHILNKYLLHHAFMSGKSEPVDSEIMFLFFFGITHVGG